MMSFFEIIAIGASAGGVKAIISLLADMPEDFPAPIVFVQHLDPTYKNTMAEILQWNCKLEVKEAENGEDLKRGVVYIAPTNRHMLVIDKKIALTITPRVNFSRPSIDALFNSVAAGYGDRAIGIILSGTGKDGSAGLKAMKDHGSTTIAQDEETSESFGMPEAAISAGAVDFILPLQDIGPAIIRLMTKQKNIEYPAVRRA
jgi:two-component system, chemotaxis family, protein-glutamate methylesterase/glutaminase